MARSRTATHPQQDMLNSLDDELGFITLYEVTAALRSVRHRASVVIARPVSSTVGRVGGGGFMDVQVVSAAIEDKPALRRLMELYKHDFSEWAGADVDEHGLFGYRYLDHYWTEPDRSPFLVRVSGKLARFALVNRRSRLVPHGQASVLAEFFIMRKYRRRGVGRLAAVQLLTGSPVRGRWPRRRRT